MRRIIKFEKSDCNPCLNVSEFLDKKGVKYERINPFDNPEMAMKFKVRTVPTVILLENDIEVKRTMGYKIEELNEIIENI